MRKFICAAIVTTMAFVLCGCNFLASDTAELLSPPALSGELIPISEAMKASIKGEYTLKYPSRGNYHSAIVREDIDNDGVLEAFAFYSTADGETVTMNLNYIRSARDKWQSLAVQSLVAGGIDMIDFCDLDKDGIKELLVGWEIYGTSEMQLAVYSLSDTALTQRMFQRYTHFSVCDLNEDDKKEIFLISVNTAEDVNSAAVYELLNGGVIEISSCELDNTAKTFNAPVISALSSGKPAVYIDEIKGIGAVTEVLFMEKGNLVNPIFDSDTGETVATLRSATFSTDDINGDGIPEIPVQRDVPSVTKSQLNEKLYLTDWCSFNGEKLTVQQTAMINVIDGYYYIIPPKLVNNIAVLKDTDNRIREIYRYNPADSLIGESLLYIKAVNKSDWTAGKYTAENATKIMENGETVFICRISDSAKKYGITIDAVKSSFELFVQE